MIRRGRKSGQYDGPNTLEEATPGSGEGYLASVRTMAVSELRSLRTLRFAGTALFASIALNFMQAAAILTMLPLKEVRPYFLQAASEGSILVNVKPLNPDLPGLDLVIESELRNYIKQRFEIVRSEQVMKERWASDGYVFWRTEESEYRRFQKQVREPLERAFESGGRRSVEIQSVLKHQGAYLVDYVEKTYDRADRLIDTANRQAVVDVTFRDQKDLSVDEKFMNPTGFTVVSVQVTTKASTENN